MRSSAHQLARRQAGQSFEDQLEAACQFYRTHEWDGTRYVAGRERLLHGGRWTERVNPFSARDIVPAAVITRSHPKAVGTPGRMRYGPKGAVDFLGHFYFRWQEDPAHRAADIPIPIAFDAKRRTGERTFSVGKDEVHQLAFLTEWAKAGCLAFYLVYDGERCYGVPSILFERLAAKETVHFEFACPVLERSQSLTKPLWDFLDLARRLVKGSAS